MNGVVAFFALVGILVIAILLAFLVVPLLLKMMAVIADGASFVVGNFLLGKTLKEFPKSTNNPVYDGKDSKQKVNLPNQVHRPRNLVVDEHEIGRIPTVHKLSKTSNSDTPQNTCNMPIQPVATKLNKVFNIFHNVCAFYQGFYSKVN
ncbi:MAG: hypothetical protein HY662_02360 [Chloroflexi bacterium]|nr:hypothetical protein [Chloroflexota bacterium]